MPLYKLYTFWMTPWLICCFTGMLLHTEGKWLLKKNLIAILPLKFKSSWKFQSFNAIDGSIKKLKSCWISKNFNYCKMKNFKTFYELQTAICLFSPHKSFLRICNKYFWSEIYRKIQEFAFQVLQEYSSWASKNGTVQMFFSETNQKDVFGVLRKYIFYNVGMVKICQMNEAFWAKLHFKASDRFG